MAETGLTINFITSKLIEAEQYYAELVDKERINVENNIETDFSLRANIFWLFVLIKALEYRIVREILDDTTVILYLKLQRRVGVGTSTQIEFDPNFLELNVRYTIDIDVDLTGYALDSQVVHKAGSETISGIKTFLLSPIVPTATLGTQAINLDQLESYIAGTVTSVSGTVNRITSTGGTNPIIDISSTFENLLGKVANPLSQFASTTSSQLAGIISDETGSGALVFANSPTLITPNLGTPSTLVGTNITGTASSLNIGGNAATVTNGVYTTTFNALGDARYPLLSGSYNDPSWINTLAYSKITGSPSSLPPSGTAGGDLIGTYPNPTVNTINSITKNYYDPTSSIQTQINSKQNLITLGTTAQYFRGDLSLATFPTSLPTTQSITFNTTGGASPGVSFDGGIARTIDYSTVGAAPSSFFTTRIIYAKQFGAHLDSDIDTGGGTDDTVILQAAIDLLNSLDGGGELLIDGVALISATLILKSNVSIRFINGGGIFLAPNSNCHMLTTVLTGQTVSNYNVAIEGGVWNGNCDNQDRWVNGDSVSYGRQWVFGMWLGSMNGYSLKNVTMRNSKTFGITISQSYNGTADNTTFIWDNTATFFNNHDSFHLWGTLDRLIINGVNSTGGDDDVIAFNTDECMPGTTDGEFEGPERGTTSAGITNVTVMDVNAHLNGRALRFIGYGTAGAYVDNINLYNFSGDVSYGMNWTNVNTAGRIAIQGWNVTDPGGQSQINIAGGCESLSLSDIAGGTPVVLGTIVNKSGDYFSQPALVSGTNIKTVNSTTLLGSGDIPFPTALPPSGTAGGDLTGSYPNPTVNTINSITKSYYDPTSSIQTQLNSKANLTGGNTLSGNQIINGVVTINGTTDNLFLNNPTGDYTVFNFQHAGSNRGSIVWQESAGSFYFASPTYLDFYTGASHPLRLSTAGAYVTGSITTTGLDNYSSDLSGSYTSRSKVDKAYVDGKTGIPAGSDGNIVSYHDGGAPVAIGRLSVQNSLDYYTPSSGGTVNLVNNHKSIIVLGGASLTINLPSSPQNGDTVSISFSAAIAAITWGNGTTSASTSTAGRTEMNLTYHTGSTTWW